MSDRKAYEVSSVTVTSMKMDMLLRARGLDSRDNSLNLIRLVLAAAVLVSHSMILAGVGDGLVWKGENLGGWAVIGFFGISGFLISGSRIRTSGGVYLINRVARIFPAYILSLLLVAFVFAPIAFHIEKGSLSGFLTTANTPGNYVFGNLLLKVGDYSVASTLSSVPYPSAWNGSLWSLYYEFWCYIIVGVFLSWKYTKEHLWPIVTLYAVSVIVQANIGRFAPLVGNNVDFILLAKMLPFFMGGAIVYFLRERIRFRLVFAAAGGVVSFGMITLFPGFGIQLAAPFMSYVVLCVGAFLPAPRISKIHDISYGVYVFAFPITQLMILVGVHQFGFLVLVAVVSILTVIAASVSWLTVERAVMRWARGKSPWGDLRRSAR